MTRNEVGLKMQATIIDALTQYPDLAGEASAAISRGLLLATDRLQQEVGQARMAMALALALLPPNRITEGAREALEACILRVLPNENRTKSEDEFIRRSGRDFPGAFE